MARAKYSLYLPENIIFMILLWLPVRSLVRFRSVCKLWRSIISDNLFIQTHLVNSHNKQAFVLKVPTRHPTDWMLYYANPTGEEFVRLNLPPECNISRVDYINSCNGLVCLADVYYKVIHILNPSTMRLKKIPTPNIQARSGISLDFGFDDITKDYKLLRSFYDVSHDVFKAELYSANAYSWKEIQAFEILQTSQIFPTSVSYMERVHKLISQREVLELYPWPSSGHLRRVSNVLDFEGSFAIVLADRTVYSLWILEDVCGTFSWNKKFNLEFDSIMTWVTSSLGDGQFVGQNYDSQCISYDYKKKEAKKFLPAAEFKDYTLVVKYTESLVSL